MTLRKVLIRSEPVELYKILKFEGLADSGAAAKAVIDAGQVKVNGVVETRKRKQIVAGDLIGFEGEQLQIALQTDVTQAPAQATLITKPKQRPKITSVARRK